MTTLSLNMNTAGITNSFSLMPITEKPQQFTFSFPIRFDTASEPVEFCLVTSSTQAKIREAGNKFYEQFVIDYLCMIRTYGMPVERTSPETKGVNYVWLNAQTEKDEVKFYNQILNKIKTQMKHFDIACISDTGEISYMDACGKRKYTPGMTIATGMSGHESFSDAWQFIKS